MQEFLASTNFTVIFISLIAIKFLLETYLKIRNLKSIELNKNRGSTNINFREKLAEEAFMETAYYESKIFNYFNQNNYSQNL